MTTQMQVIFDAFLSLGSVMVFCFVLLQLIYADKYIQRLCAWYAKNFGFCCHHSDSGKRFYSLTMHDALEWAACTYATATISRARTGVVLAVKQVV